jgi:hypothetical protein
MMHDAWQWHPVSHAPVATVCSEAEKLEQAEEFGHDLNIDMDGDGEATGNMLTKIDEKNNAVILINASGTMQMVNKVRGALVHAHRWKTRAVRK